MTSLQPGQEQKMKEQNNLFFAIIVYIVITPPFCCYGTISAGELSLQVTKSTKINETSSSSTKPRLTIHTVANYGGFPCPLGSLCTEGMRMAIDASMERLKTLSNRYEIEFELHDEKCDYATGVKAVTNILELSRSDDNTTDTNTVPLMITPICGENAYAGMMLQHYNFVGAADFSTIIDQYANRQKYNSFFALNPSFEIFYEAIPAFIQSQGWSRVFLITETFFFWNSLEDLLSRELAKRNILLAGTSKVVIPPDMMPTTEHFDTAVQELADKNPRIIIVNSCYLAILPCYLHRHKLYGPNYVYIFLGSSYFLPKTQLRAAECTDEMLLDVLQNIILFSYGSPINVNNEAVDALGTTKTFIEQNLIRIMGQPQLEDSWFFWRATCYNQAAATLWLLDKVEKTLQGNGNDTLLNWVTEGENFRKNGTYIHSLLQKSFENLSYKGMTSTGNERSNSRKGLTGFYQMQMVANGSKGHTISETIRAVPIATYDSSKGANAKVEEGPGKIIWRGPNGQAPFDSDRVIPIKNPLISTTATGVLMAFTSLLLLTNGLILGMVVYKKSSADVSNSLPWFNVMISLGNILVSLFVLVLPVEGDLTSHVNCMSASLILVAGFTLVVTSLMAKMEVGHAIYSLQKKYQVSVKTRGATTTRHGQHSSHMSTSANVPQASTIGRHSPLKAYNSTPAVAIGISCSTAEFQALLKRKTKILSIGAIVWAVIQIVVMAIWFGLAPIETTQFDREMELSRHDLSLFYKHYTVACSLSYNNDNNDLTTGFIVALIGCYGLVLLRSLYLAFVLRKVTIDEIDDLHLIRTTSYSTAIQIVASGVVVAAFFNDEDPGTLQTAIASVVLIFVGLNTAIVFIPKLMTKQNSSAPRN